MPPLASRSLPFEDARHLAAERGWREKVLIYVTRREDLLVLEHATEDSGADVQVPAGGVEPGEVPEAAAVRELFEETGLHLGSQPLYLESHHWAHAEAPSRIRHYYWVTTPAETPDSWSHLVSARQDDCGLIFSLTFRPLADPGLTPGFGWEGGLARLRSIMKQRQ